MIVTPTILELDGSIGPGSGRKLIAYGDDSNCQLFDIEADPAESQSRLKTDRVNYEEMVAVYQAKRKEIKDVGPCACRTLKGAPVGRAY